MRRRNHSFIAGSKIKPKHFSISHLLFSQLSIKLVSRFTQNYLHIIQRITHDDCNANRNKMKNEDIIFQNDFFSHHFAFFRTIITSQESQIRHKCRDILYSHHFLILATYSFISSHDECIQLLYIIQYFARFYYDFEDDMLSKNETRFLLAPNPAKRVKYAQHSTMANEDEKFTTQKFIKIIIFVGVTIEINLNVHYNRTKNKEELW